MLQYPMILRREKIPKGDKGVARTLEVMTDLSNRATGDSNFRIYVLDLLREVPPYNQRLEVERLFRFVRDAIQYRKDPVGKEFVADPVHTLSIGAGDCDDKATLLKAMLAVVGYPSKFVVSGVGGRFPRPRFQHVFLLTRVPPHGWIPLDPTRKFRPGFIFPGTTRAGIYGGRGTIKEASLMRNRVKLSQPLAVPRRMLEDDSARELTGLYLSSDGLELDGDLAGLFSGLKKLAKKVGGAIKKVASPVLSIASAVIPGGGLIKAGVAAASSAFASGGDAPAPAAPPPAAPIPPAAPQPARAPQPTGQSFPPRPAAVTGYATAPIGTMVLPGVTKPSPATSTKTILMVGGGILLVFMMMTMMMGQRR